MVNVIPLPSVPSTSNLLLFWVGIWEKNLPNMIQFTLRTSNGVVGTKQDLSNAGDWHSRGTPPRNRVWWRWVSSQIVLDPDIEYYGDLEIDGQPSTTGIVKTLPRQLPDKGAGKPFIMFAGSCYYRRNDPNRVVPDAYMHLWNDTNWRPDVKFLCGDQIYFDNPPEDFITSITHEWIRTRLTNKYRGTWEALDPLLSRGITYFLTDDHEYYNDYPNRGNAPWVFLGHPYDDYLKNKTEEFAGVFQPTFSKGEFRIGGDLEFMVLDTRRFRSLNARTFALQADFDRVIQWITNLSSPGVLVLSSPIFVQQTEISNFNFAVTSGSVVTDHNLPYFFAQFTPLANALLNAKVDIVVVAGDPHFSRVAICDVASPPHKIVEVISSAMSTVDRAGGRPHDEPTSFPLPNYSSITPSGIRYLHHSRNKPQSQDAADNFVTLSFTSVNHQLNIVEMRIRSWLCKRRDNSKQPPVPVDFEETIQLNGIPIYPVGWIPGTP